MTAMEKIGLYGKGAADVAKARADAVVSVTEATVR